MGIFLGNIVGLLRACLISANLGIELLHNARLLIYGRVVLLVEHTLALPLGIVIA